MLVKKYYKTSSNLNKNNYGQTIKSAITFNFVIIVATLALIYFKIINVNIDTTLGLFKLGLFIALVMFIINI